MSLKELRLTGRDILEVAKALSSETTLRILHLLSEEKLDVSTIARRLDLSESYISEEIQRLKNLQLINVSYASGKKGIRKICELAVGRIIMEIKP